MNERLQTDTLEQALKQFDETNINARKPADLPAEQYLYETKVAGELLKHPEGIAAFGLIAIPADPDVDAKGIRLIHPDHDSDQVKETFKTGVKTLHPGQILEVR